LRDVSFGDVDEEEILHRGVADKAVAVAIGEIGSDAELCWRDAAAKDGGADGVETGLLLGDDAEMIAMNLSGKLFGFRGIEGEAEAFMEGGQEGIGGPAVFKEKKFEAGFFAGLAKDFGVAEQFGDGADDGDDLMWVEEDVEPEGEMGLCGETAGNAEGEAEIGRRAISDRRPTTGGRKVKTRTLKGGGCGTRVMRAEGGGEGDVVDFGVGAPVGAGGDGNLEFARKIVEVGIAGKFLAECADDGSDVGKFEGVDTGKRAAGDVASNVAAGTRSGKADGIEALEDFRDRFDLDPVQLNVLADGNVGDAVAVFGGEIGDGADLLAGEKAVGDANAHHEKGGGLPFSHGAAGDAVAVALGVDAPGTEVRAEPLGRNGSMAFAGEGTDFFEVLPRIFCALEALDALSFGFF